MAVSHHLIPATGLLLTDSCGAYGGLKACPGPEIRPRSGRAPKERTRPTLAAIRPEQMTLS